MSKPDFKVKDLHELFHGGEVDGYELIEESEWEQCHKTQSCYFIFKYDGLYYRYWWSRSGSYHSDWEYDEINVKHVEEVKKVEKIRVVTEWEVVE